MARPAPAVERAVQILDFLADHPTDAFSLSELARRLDMNKASAHATLSALVDAGYLLRHPTRKDYHLGPRLMTVGEAARNQFPVVDFARDELRRLSDDLAMECVASTAVADEMVIVDRAGPVRPIGVTVAVGYRFPLVPPDGHRVHGLVGTGPDRRVAAAGRATGRRGRARPATGRPSPPCASGGSRPASTPTPAAISPRPWPAATRPGARTSGRWPTTSTS